MHINKYNIDQDDLKYYDKINPNWIAEKILSKEVIITFDDTKEVLAYDDDSGLYVPFKSELEKIIQHICTNRTKTHLVNEVIASIQRQTSIKREEVGKNIDLIPLKDGIYSLKSNKLLPYSSKYIFLTKHPIVYYAKPLDPLTTNPIDTFLEQICEKQEDQLLIKEMIGYCYYRQMPFQNLFLLYGSGGNGKSVLLDIIRNMLGEENISGQSLQSLTINRFAAASLYNKNANIFGDLPNTILGDSGALKELTGGDLFTAEKKFQDSFTFYNHAKIIASCNEVPETKDDSDAWYRRIIIINFPHSFNDCPDRNLIEKLCTEEYLSDFFKSCIDAFRMALKDNFLIRKEDIQTQKERYRHFSNSAMAFISDCLELDPESKIETTLLYAHYVAFCKERQTKAYTEDWFFRKLYKTFPNQIWKNRVNKGQTRVHFVNGVYFKDISVSNHPPHISI